MDLPCGWRGCARGSAGGRCGRRGRSRCARWPRRTTGRRRRLPAPGARRDQRRRTTGQSWAVEAAARRPLPLRFRLADAARDERPLSTGRASRRRLQKKKEKKTRHNRTLYQTSCTSGHQNGSHCGTSGEAILSRLATTHCKHLKETFLTGSWLLPVSNKRYLAEEEL